MQPASRADQPAGVVGKARVLPTTQRLFLRRVRTNRSRRRLRSSRQTPRQSGTRRILRSSLLHSPRKFALSGKQGAGKLAVRVTAGLGEVVGRGLVVSPGT